MILKYVIVYLLVILAIVHDIVLFSSRLMYLEFNTIVEC